MKNHYLEILELEPGATQEEIKKAYRRLSKKYHPDINKDVGADERFMAIKEAYEFLKNVGPYPHHEQVAYDYNTRDREYDARREYIRKKAREQAIYEEESKRKVDRFFRVVNRFTFIVTGLFFLEILLPARTYKVSVVETYSPYSVSYSKYGHKAHYDMDNNRIIITTTQGIIELGEKYRNQVPVGDQGILGKSLFTGMGKYYISDTTDKKMRSSMLLYDVFIWCPVTMLLASLLAISTRKRSVLWNAGAAAFVLLPITIYLIYISVYPLRF